MPPRMGLVMSIGEHAPRSRVIEFAQRAEALGYDALWMGESWGRDVFTGLTHIACSTSRIKLATGIVNVFSRTPALIAQTIASLDEISGGRAILGLGSSGEKVVRDWHGLPFERPVARTREYIEAINLILSGARADYSGNFVKIRDFQLRFNPPRRKVPIYVAAMGPKNIEMVGEVADGWSPVFFSLGHLPEFRRQLQAGAARRARPLDAVAISPWLLCCVTDDLAQARDLARGHLAYYVGGMGRYYNELMQRYGYVEEAKRIRELWLQRDRKGAAALVTDAMVDAIAIVGPRRRCQERMLEMEAQGVSAPVVFLPFSLSRDQLRDTIEGLAPKSFA
ncbi:MAG: LLM class flavin-dependent oxidoreductase [Chloroflexi bacterium]|nr:LLM class flavin-dependent oxidoreductase [Chloroflexota bacterium]